MQSENKPQHWKEKLADVKALSCENALNKEVAWETLNNRLKNRSKRRKVMLYWFSAACMLPLLFLLPFFYGQSHSDEDKPVLHIETAKKTQPVNKKPEHKQDIIAKSITPAAKNNTYSETKENKPVIIAENEKSLWIQNNDSLSGYEDKKILADTEMDTVKAMAVIQEKRKLKVVHINELDEPQPPAPVMARNIFRRSFPLHVMILDDETKPSQTVQSTSFISLKTQPSSN